MAGADAAIRGESCCARGGNKATTSCCGVVHPRDEHGLISTRMYVDPSCVAWQFYLGIMSVYGGAAVSVGWWAGVVRLRVPTPGLPSRAQVWAAVRRRGGGSRTGTPPSLDFARSPPCPPDHFRPLDAAARSDSAVWLSGGWPIVVRAPAGRPHRCSGVTAELLGGNVAPAAT